MKVNNLNLALSLFLLIVIMIVSCSSTVETEDSWTYQIVEIDGMTCVKWNSTVGYVGGLTCNWDEWKSEADMDWRR